jgi:hypothetical protein
MRPWIEVAFRFSNFIWASPFSIPDCPCFLSYRIDFSINVGWRSVRLSTAFDFWSTKANRTHVKSTPVVVARPPWYTIWKLPGMHIYTHIYTLYIYILSIYLAFYLTFYLTFFLAYILTFYLTCYEDSILTYFTTLRHSFPHCVWHLFWHTFWNIFWHSFWQSIWHSIGHSIWQIF